MNLLINKIITSLRVLLIIGTMAAPMVVQAQEATVTGSDLRLEAQLDTLYRVNPVLTPYTITTRVENGTAHLGGTVGNVADKELAEQLARSFDGIQSVQNNITISESAITAEQNRNRSLMQKVADATATAQIKGKLEANRNTSGINATVATNNGVVTLKGTARSVPEKDIAGQIAANTPGIRSVDNELVVQKDLGRASLGKVDLDKAAASAGSALTDIGGDMSDAWIYTKVSSTLIFTRGLESGGISVKSDNGIVTLSGYVPTEAEKKLAKKLAQDVRGVKDVRNQLAVR